MDKSMNKTESGKPRGRRGGEKGNLLLREELDKLAEEVANVAQEMELVSTEVSTLEDIEGGKVLAAGVLEKYSALEKRLTKPDRKLLEQSIGPAVERIKKGLTLLKEAPE
jgi:hypothetical protein